ncbi:hypothetical protein ES705_30587 [subsurface metagenome]
MEAITKEKMQAFEIVRRSGVTNMMDVENVIRYADKFCDTLLTRDDYFYIIKNYPDLMEKFNIKRELDV